MFQPQELVNQKSAKFSCYGPELPGGLTREIVSSPGDKRTPLSSCPIPSLINCVDYTWVSQYTLFSIFKNNLCNYSLNTLFPHCFSRKENQIRHSCSKLTRTKYTACVFTRYTLVSNLKAVLATSPRWELMLGPHNHIGKFFSTSMASAFHSQLCNFAVKDVLNYTLLHHLDNLLRISQLFFIVTTLYCCITK